MLTALRLPFAASASCPRSRSYTLQAAIGRQRAVEVGLAALAKAREIAQWPISALVGIERTLQVAHRAGVAAALAAENEGMRRLAGSPENIEAVTAFMQKCPPDFEQFRKPR